MSDQLVAEAATYTTHNKHNTRHIHARRWIRSRNPSIRAAADLRLRPHGHLDRSINICHVFPRYITRPNLESHNISSPVTNKLCALLHSLLVISDEILHDTAGYLKLISVCADVRSSISTKPDCEGTTHNDTEDYIPN